MQPEERKEALSVKELAGMIEAILFVAGDPVERKVLSLALEITDLQLEAALEQLADHLASMQSGIKLMRYEDKLQLVTKAHTADYVERALNPAQKQNLSGALLETLSVIAYKQPVTKADVEQVRGVKCDYSVATLCRLGLIEEVGRKETLGRPILYGTTQAFLQHFGIGALDELPALKTQSAEEFNEPL